MMTRLSLLYCALCSALLYFTSDNKFIILICIAFEWKKILTIFDAFVKQTVFAPRLRSLFVIIKILQIFVGAHKKGYHIVCYALLCCIILPEPVIIFHNIGSRGKVFCLIVLFGLFYYYIYHTLSVKSAILSMLKKKDERWKMKYERWNMKDERWKIKDERRQMNDEE